MIDIENKIDKKTNIINICNDNKVTSVPTNILWSIVSGPLSSNLRKQPQDRQKAA